MDNLLLLQDFDPDFIGHKLFQSYISTVADPLHNLASDDFSGLQGCIGANCGELYLSDEKEALDFMAYLRVNGGWAIRPCKHDGTCMFAALRRMLDAPMEFSSGHLKRWIIVRMCYNAKFFYTILQNFIRYEYGYDRLSKEELAKREKAGTISDKDLADQQVPGPHSFKGYLKYMLKSSSWGDLAMVVCFSLQAQAAITIIDSSTRVEQRIRHNRSLLKTDGVIVHCGLVHYTGTG